MMSAGGEGGAGGAPELSVTVITVSDRASRGEYEDRSGPRVEELIRTHHPEALVQRVIVPDEHDGLTDAIRAAVETNCHWVITTGGTGIGPRDITPEVTLPFLQRQLPGIAEAIRQESLKETATAALSRGISGMSGTTIIVNLPGSVGAVETGMRVLNPIMGHAVAMIAGGGH